APESSGKPVFLLGGAVSRYVGSHYGTLVWSEQYIGVPKDYRYYQNHADKNDANIFLKTDLHLRPGLTGLIDLQLRRVGYAFLGFDDQKNAVDQSVTLPFFNPKLGLNWQIMRHWSASAFFGIANREPNRDDYTQSTPGSRPKPEHLNDLEIGLKTQHVRWFASANFYWMDYRNQLVLDGRLNNVGASIRTNVPGSYRAGLELETAIQVHPRWLLSANAAFSRNKVREFTEYRDNWDSGGQDEFIYRNSDLAYSPEVITRGELTWTILDKKAQNLAISWAGKYVGQQFLDNTSNAYTTLPGYFYSDLRLNYNLKKVIGEQVSVILAVNNLLDARYASNGWTYRYTSAGYDGRPDDPYTRLEENATYNLSGFFPQAGRNWMGTVVLRF
ncbi:MAG: TonB-dependent receptor, partial [Saprospiraceae bacterium]